MSGTPFPTAGYGGSQPPSGLPVVSAGTLLGNAQTLSMGADQNFDFTGTTLELDGGGTSASGGVVFDGETYSTVIAGAGMSLGGVTPILTFANTASTGGGYSAGTVPTIAQVAYQNTGLDAVTFAASPESGDYLVAMYFGVAEVNANTGWTAIGEDASGTDYGYAFVRTAGASEPEAQTIITGGSAPGCLVVWDVRGQSTISPLCGVSISNEQTADYCIPTTLPLSINAIGLSAVGIVSGGGTLVSVLNEGTQDLNVTGARGIVASHTDLSKTPQAGIGATFSATTSSKNAVVIVTA